jgi:capsular exopolysaccharide synthesis family protein
VVRSRARIIIVTTVVVTAVAVGASLLMTPLYQGQATIMLSLQNTGTALLGAPQLYRTDMALQRDVQTQVNVMRSAVILRRVIDSMQLSLNPTELAKKVTVKFDGETNIVTIEVTDKSADHAAKIANAIAKSYVSWSQEQQRSSIGAAVVDVEKRLVAAEKQIADVQTAINAGDRSGTRQAELDAAKSLYKTLSDNVETLKINEQLSSGYGSILSTASPDPVPVSPKPVRNGALGLVLGLLLGLGIALVVETLDNTIKSAEEIKELYDAPVLCSIPIEVQKGTLERLSVIDSPGGPTAEAYRVLRNNLGFINFEHDIKTVLVTSAMPSEGKSTVAANLATVLARAGKSVVLVSCDFHQPGSARFFHVDNRFGLSDVLRGTMTVQGVMERPKDIENIAVIPAGNKPPNPSELLGSAAMEEMIATLRESVDWVILDTAPLLVVADAAAAARWVDGVLVVAQANSSTRDAARQSREQLENVGARILGVAFWGIEDTTVRGGYSNYGASGTRA